MFTCLASSSSASLAVCVCFSFMNEMRVNLFRSFRTAFDIAAHTAQLYKQPNDQQASQQPNPTQPNPPLTSQPNSQAGKQSASHPCYPLLAVSSNQQPPPKWKAASQTGVEVPQSTAFCGRCNKFCFLDEDDDVNIALPHPICKFPSSLHFPFLFYSHSKLHSNCK